MNDPTCDGLPLKNQLCFPLYACSKELIKLYKPHLEQLDLTYTQYIAMLVLWDKRALSVAQLGRYLYLDSGTLTPLLKKLEAKGYISRTRSKQDERSLVVSVTQAGMALREQATALPAKISSCLALEPGETAELHRLLFKILGRLA